ncbi:MAG: hypothetical protein ACJATK_002812 [Paracoccaceae bacterium]|jgi:hypothetical protein
MVRASPAVGANNQSLPLILRNRSHMQNLQTDRPLYR